jgi:alkylation response protein AidB-like acyl-CoA dehydrogenase
MKEKVEYSSESVLKTITDRIREAASEAERLGKLHNTQLDAIYQQKWFNMYVPHEYGGLDWPLPKILRTEESLASADGSTAWVVTLCSGAAWFIGFLDPELAKEVFKNDKVCFAGSGAVTGTANENASGFEVNGYWKYASGSHHATVFTANCHLQKNGQPLYHADGSPVVRAFLFKRDEVTIHKTWNSMGMIATGSHAFEVKELQVLRNRSFVIDAAQAKLDRPLYKYPFLQLAETTLAVNLSGMAVRFLELCFELFAARNGNGSQKQDLLQRLAASQAKLNEYRHQFYTHSDAAWEALVEHAHIPEPLLAEVSKASHTLAHRSRELVDELYPYCGLAAADLATEINRVWRNLHTAGQHSLFTTRGQ